MSSIKIKVKKKFKPDWVLKPGPPPPKPKPHTPKDEELVPMESAADLWKHMFEMQRIPSMKEVEEGKSPRYFQAFATLVRDCLMREWRGHHEEERVFTAPKGSRVRVVMASRFGDVGLTTDLGAVTGYDARVPAVQETSDEPADVQWLTDIQMFEVRR